MKKKMVILFAFVAVTCLEVYSIFPRSKQLYCLFPFHSQCLTKQVYFDYLAKILAISILLFALFKFSPFYRDRLFILWLLSLGYLVDYLLIYNDPFTNLFGMQISYTTFMIPLSIVIFIQTMIEK